jgi:putative oxygen-independent coproporphyrinogen III oxidase
MSERTSHRGKTTADVGEENRGGIYVHLPYCASRCGYCAFVVTTDPSSRSEYLKALAHEMELAAKEALGTGFDSIYLGGGTPSLLPAEEIGRLLDRLRERFDVIEDAEITLEANPEDVTVQARDAWIGAGVTRVSVGVQSFEDGELAAVGRRHDARRARESLAILAASCLSLSGDLILGLPGQTAASFRRSVEALCESRVGHISIYLLETEKSKVLEEDRRARPHRYLSDDEQAELWLEMGEALADRGYAHYEISNWARPGSEAVHNLKYWTRTPTLGLGISAHEFWKGRRRSNASALPLYLERLSRGERPTALDRALGAEEEVAERIVLGLRLSEGVSREEVEDWIDRRGDQRLRSDYAAWRKEGLLRVGDDRVALTERGYLLSNEVLCRFV